MKLLATLLTNFLFFSYTLQAQNASYLGVEFALTASESYFFGTDQDNPELVRAFNNLVQHKLNWNFAITYDRELKGNVLFKTGIEIASQGYIIRDLMLTDVNGTVVGTVAERNNTLYLGIPLSLRAEFPVAKIAPYLEGGLTPSIDAIDNSVSTDFLTFETERRFNPLFNRLAIATNFAIGSNYLLSEKHTLYAQVHGQGMLLDFYRGNRFYGVYYSVGLRAGVRMAI